MKKITLTLIVTIMSLGIAFSQTVVDPALHLPFDTEKVPEGEDRVSIVDSTNAVHPNPTTAEERWLEYEGGVLVDTSQLADTTMDRGTVLQIDEHSFLKVEEEFFDGKDQWTISYWTRWIRPQGWWRGHANWFGTHADTLVGGWTHWKGWRGWGELAGLGSFGFGLNNNGQKFVNNDWLHVTIAYHDSTMTYFMSDSIYSQGVAESFKDWETISYLLSMKGQSAETPSGMKLQVEDDSSRAYSQEMQVDDLRLYDIALTEDEVASMHNGEDIERTYISSVTIGTESGETEIKMEDSLQMTADISPSDATWPDVDWSIEGGTGSATVNDTGLLKPTAIGTVTVKATATDGSGVTATQDISITGIMVSDITVSSANPGDSVKVDNTLQMSAEVSPDDAADTTFTWSVVNGTGSALIDEDGLLTGVLAGTVDVIATANDGSGTADTLEVIVWEETVEVTDITLSAESETVAVNETLQINAEVSPEDATDPSVSWSVEEGTGSAEIDSDGVLTPDETGTVTVVATANDGSGVEGTLEITIEESTGINDPVAGAVKVYPNPSNGTFNISLDGQQAVKYEIYNAIGAKVQSGILQPDSQLQFKSADEGVYYLKVDTEAGQAVKKLIVQ